MRQLVVRGVATRLIMGPGAWNSGICKPNKRNKMDKNARVEEGHTPSLQSGRRSTMVKRGQALAEGEQPEKDERQLVVSVEEHQLEKPE